MKKIIAVTNQKGGVGKTTTAINLAASLVATRRRILLVDLDPQGNATMGSGVDKNNLEQHVYHVLIEGVLVKDVVVRAEQAGYDVLPSNGDVTAAEVELLTVSNRERRLEVALAAVRDDYDVIIMDCPPSLNMLTVNALTAADAVLIPVQCEYFALEGIAALLETIEQIQVALNPRLTVEGVLRTMYDGRTSLANDVSKELKKYFGDKLYRTVIPRNIRVAEAPSYGLPVMQYDQSSRGALSYLALAGELIRRQED
ncbi:MAG: AAA family ATPase [Natronospirillum sp.]